MVPVFDSRKAHTTTRGRDESLVKNSVGGSAGSRRQVVRPCNENRCFNPYTAIYYPGRVHHLDGDITNESFSNLAMVCPKCQSHILLSRYSPKDIWLLKAKGLNLSEIGRLLDISRERARQLSKKYEPQLTTIDELDINKLIKEVQHIEKRKMEAKYRWAEARRISKQTRGMTVEDAYYESLEEGRHMTLPKRFKKRVTDKRTIRKRVLAEMQRMGIKPKMIKGATNERTHNQEG